MIGIDEEGKSKMKYTKNISKKKSKIEKLKGSEIVSCLQLIGQF